MNETAKTIKVTLVKSLIGRLKRHRQCVYGLGLRRINSTAEVPDTLAIRSMIEKVKYLLKVG